MEEDTPEGYSYVLTALRPSIVNKSVAGSFLGVGQTNLVTSKSSYIEVFSLEESQQLLQCEFPVYLRVRELITIRTMYPVDLLFMVLDIYFVIAAFDFQSRQLRPLYSEKMLTRENSDAPYLVFNIYNPPNPSTKQFSVGFSVDGVFSLSRYEMNLSYSAIHGLSGNITSRNYDFTIEAGLDILDVVFMEGGTSVTFIRKDSESRAISVKSYDIDCEHSLLIPRLISGQTNDPSTCVLVPVAIQGGAITIGSKEINYFGLTGKKMISFPPPPEIEDDEGQQFLIKLCEPIDQNLYLYGDVTSRLYLIQIERNKDGEVTKLHRIELGFQGEVNCCTKLAKIQSENSSNVAYLVFIGTLKGDAKFMTIIPSNPPEQRVETEAIFKTFYAKNFSLNESDPRSTTIVGCSDQYNYLNILKSGASVTEYAAFEQNNVKAVWAVKRQSTEEYHTFLVFSFIGHTRILRAGKDVYEMVIDSIKSDVETLYIGNADHDFIVQVVPSGITLLNSSMTPVSQWKVPSGVITAAASAPSQVTVAQGKTLYHFKIEEAGLLLQATSTHSDDIAFIIYEENTKRVGLNIFVAFWHSNRVQCQALPTLHILSTIELDEPLDAVIRCLAYRNRNLLIGLGDGRVLQYDYDPKTHVMSKRRTFSLGTTQARCVSVDVGDNDYFFACSDKPSLLITDELGLRPISVNSSSPISFVCPFKFEYLEDWAFVAVSDTDVRIITVENVQKLHSAKFDMKEYTPNDVDYYPPNNIYSVMTSKEGGAYIHLVDINLPVDHPQNQYSFVIDDDAEPRCMCYARMRKEKTGQMIDFISAVTYAGEYSTLSLYEVKRNSEGIYVLAEYQSVQFENKVVSMKPFQDMIVLCCAESMVLVWLNRQGEIDFPAEGEGLFFHSIGVDPKSGLVVPLSLSTELDLFTVTWRQDEAKFTPVEVEPAIGFKCRDLPVQVAFLDGFKQHLVAGTLRGQLQFFFGPTRRKQRMFEYNLSDTLTLMRNTKEGHILYTTIGGAVGLCKQLTKEEYDLFIRIQSRLNDLIPMLVPVSHSELRFNYSNIEDEDYETQVVKSNLIDGEFVMKYLTLSDDLKEQIAKEVHMTMLDLDEKIVNFNQQLLFS